MKQENIIKDKSYKFALKIIKLIRQLPKNNEGFVLGKQLLRSGTSIGANVEEAIAAFSKQDFTFKMSIALKEARETYYWLRLISDSDLISENVEELKTDAYELIRILTSIVKTSQNR